MKDIYSKIAWIFLFLVMSSSFVSVDASERSRDLYERFQSDVEIFKAVDNLNDIELPKLNIPENLWKEELRFYYDSYVGGHVFYRDRLNEKREETYASYSKAILNKFPNASQKIVVLSKVETAVKKIEKISSKVFKSESCNAKCVIRKRQQYLEYKNFLYALWYELNALILLEKIDNIPELAFSPEEELKVVKSILMLQTAFDKETIAISESYSEWVEYLGDFLWTGKSNILWTDMSMVANLENLNVKINSEVMHYISDFIVKAEVEDDWIKEEVFFTTKFEWISDGVLNLMRYSNFSTNIGEEFDEFMDPMTKALVQNEWKYIDFSSNLFNWTYEEYTEGDIHVVEKQGENSYVVAIDWFGEALYEKYEDDLNWMHFEIWEGTFSIYYTEEEISYVDYESSNVFLEYGKDEYLNFYGHEWLVSFESEVKDYKIGDFYLTVYDWENQVVDIMSEKWKITWKVDLAREEYDYSSETIKTSTLRWEISWYRAHNFGGIVELDLDLSLNPDASLLWNEAIFELSYKEWYHFISRLTWLEEEWITFNIDYVKGKSTVIDIEYPWVIDIDYTAKDGQIKWVASSMWVSVKMTWEYRFDYFRLNNEINTMLIPGAFSVFVERNNNEYNLSTYELWFSYKDWEKYLDGAFELISRFIRRWEVKTPDFPTEYLKFEDLTQ